VACAIKYLSGDVVVSMFLIFDVSGVNDIKLIISLLMHQIKKQILMKGTCFNLDLWVCWEIMR
jgi:hypothetical protein